ncbi:hypothetical protein GCM10027091_40210 [Streptomyces daliensis]
MLRDSGDLTCAADGTAVERRGREVLWKVPSLTAGPSGLQGPLSMTACATGARERARNRRGVDAIRIA